MRYKQRSERITKAQQRYNDAIRDQRPETEINDFRLVLELLHRVNDNPSFTDILQTMLYGKEKFGFIDQSDNIYQNALATTYYLILNKKYTVSEGVDHYKFFIWKLLHYALMEYIPDNNEKIRNFLTVWENKFGFPGYRYIVSGDSLFSCYKKLLELVGLYDSFKEIKNGVERLPIGNTVVMFIFNAINNDEIRKNVSENYQIIRSYDGNFTCQLQGGRRKTRKRRSLRKRNHKN